MHYSINVLFQEKASNDNLKVIVSRSHKGDIEKILQKKFDKKVAIISAAGAGKSFLFNYPF